MDILITAPSLDTSKNVSGISSVVTNIIKHCKYHFHHFLVGKEDNEKTGFRWIIKQFGLFFKFPKAAKDCDIIHINTALNPLSIVRDFSFVLLSKLFHKKVLLHIHGGKYLMADCSNFILKRIIHQLIKLSDFTIVLSQMEMERIINKHKVTRITYLVNSIPADELSFSRSPKLPEEPLVITFLGRIHESKGIEDIVEAITQLNSLNTNFIFNLYGTGPLEKYVIDSLTEILGVRFTYYGVVGGEAKWQALERSDIFLLPSRYGEGLPMAMLEAMAVGNVVVATDDASITYAVKNKINGIIVYKYNPNDISQKLNELLKDHEQVKVMSENAIQTIQQKFNLRNYIEQLESIYGSIC